MQLERLAYRTNDGKIYVESITTSMFDLCVPNAQFGRFFSCFISLSQLTAWDFVCLAANYAIPDTLHRPIHQQQSPSNKIKEESSTRITYTISSARTF